MLRFRESFRGYNRDDVNAYIQQINFQFSKKEAELRAVITDLEIKLSQNSSKQSQLDFDSLNSELETLKIENSKLKSDIDDLNAKISSDCDEKNKLYDSMSAQVGSIIIQANCNADKILNDARADAENIKLSAEIQAKEIITNAQKKKEETLNSIESFIKSASAECINEYNVIIDEANDKLNSICDTVKYKADKILFDLDTKTANIKAE